MRMWNKTCRTFGYERRFLGLQVAHDREVLVALAKRFLVDADEPDDSLLAPPQPTSNRPHHDPVDLVPTDPHSTHDGLEREFPQPGNHALFEERREAAALLGPRHDDLLDAVRLTVDSRNLRADEEPVLAEVQMPPAARARVVLACRLAADRAARGSVMNHEDFNELLSNVQLAIDQTPGSLDSKNGCVEFEITHP